jgi:hypothetical protein
MCSPSASAPASWYAELVARLYMSWLLASDSGSPCSSKARWPRQEDVGY